MSGRGALWVPYRFSYPAERLHAPWVSALAQGNALSFFVRLYRVTGRPADLATARALLMGFRALGRSGSPWVAYVDAARYLRLEEYPGLRPSHVLNGADFGVFGLYDYAMLTGDPTAVRLLRGHLTSIRQYLATYRVPGGISRYDLVHRGGSLHYHTIHIEQLRTLARMSGNAWFGQMAALFARDHPPG